MVKQGLFLIEAVVAMGVTLIGLTAIGLMYNAIVAEYAQAHRVSQDLNQAQMVLYSHPAHEPLYDMQGECVVALCTTVTLHNQTLMRVHVV